MEENRENEREIDKDDKKRGRGMDEDMPTMS